MRTGIHKCAGLLGLPVFLLVAIALFRWDGGAVAAPPAKPAHECGETAERPSLPLFDAPDEAAGGPSVRPDSADSEAPMPVVSALQQAENLLYALGACVNSGERVYPERILADITALIDRSPGTAEVFLDGVAEATALVKAWLKVAFIRVGDAAQREDLLARHRARDPVPARIEELLGDTGMVLATLRYPGDPEVRYGLINRLGNDLLAEPEVMETLLQLAEQDIDPKVRAKALTRLGRLDDPAVKALLFRALRDGSRALTDRQAAARMLCTHPDEETAAEFVAILERGAEPSILRFAARGLGTAAGRDPAARAALNDLLIDPAADLAARKNAASSLAGSLRKLGELEREQIGMQVIALIKDLASREDDDGSLLVHAIREVGRSMIGDRLNGELMSIIENNIRPQLREEVLADARLMRHLETRR